MDEQEPIGAKYATLRPFLDERRRRLWAADEALALGRGGVTLVAAATGLARNTIGVGLRELRAGGEPAGGTASSAAGGRRREDRQRRGGWRPQGAHAPRSRPGA